MSDRSNDTNHEDPTSLAKWAEGMARFYLQLASEPERHKASRRTNAYRAKQMRRIAAVLRQKGRMHG